MEFKSYKLYLLVIGHILVVKNPVYGIKLIKEFIRIELTLNSGISTLKSKLDDLACRFLLGLLSSWLESLASSSSISSLDPSDSLREWEL